MLFFALAVLVAGCTPAGPRALLQGKKSLERGEFAEAAGQFKTATTLLVTNANAWNYYGVALQGAGHPDEAAAAYKRALELDRDLVETHLNLGSLWLEQNKPDAAKTEFTAYRLRRPNDAAGWLKLGSAQLKLGESGAAETSFSTVLALKSNNDAEAYNGLGLACIQRGVPRDAVKFFAEAVKSRPDFAPAILNLATVNQQYLHDHKAALKNYRAYLALKPRPGNWDDVNALAGGLEKSEVKIAAVTTPVEKTNPPAPETKPPPKPVTVTTRPVLYNQPEPVVKSATHNPPTVVRSTTVPSSTPPPTVPPQVVQVKPAPAIVTTPAASAPEPNPVTASAMTVEPPSLRAAMPPPEKKSGFWHGLFGSSKETPANGKYSGGGLTPLPPVGDAAEAPTTKAVVPAVAKPVEPAPVFSRYNYFSPRKPAAGDRTAAGGAFTKARLLEQDEKWPDALQWYQQAAALDPAWFEAQYNTGVLAHKLRNFALALPRYETALSLQPDSADARYNFSLALKAAGFPADAAEELKKILAANPGETRAHLALANLCAQSLRDTAQARAHYQKVLELDPASPQAQDIRYWLSANPR